MSKSNRADLLTEVKDNWQYARNYWAPIRREAEKDIAYQTVGPWTGDDLTDRKDRVTLVLDEINQYNNQIVNQFRLNERGIKLTPRGNGANDQTAQIRQGIIREIEYRSKAQMAYVGAATDMVRRSYGYFKLKTEYQSKSMRRCIVIKRIPNPDVIWLDPDAQELDWSDAAFSFEVERFRERDFVKRFGNKVDKTSFSDQDVHAEPDWVSSGDGGKFINVAAYCKRVNDKKKLYQLENGREVSGDTEGVQVDGKSISVAGEKYAIAEQRDNDDWRVIQYITNGLEIIDEEPLDFTEVPIIPMFGREVWTTTGGVSRRMFESAMRHARDPFKAFCYVGSAEVEVLASIPKAPYEGYEGQFATQTDFTTLARNPQGYVEFKAQTSATGEMVLPLPRKNLASVDLQAYEMAGEKLRRSIQSAMGSSPLPTATQRLNEKSGVALEKIQQTADVGNYNFTLSYEQALERAGRMIDEALPKVYDVPQQLGARDATGDKVQMVDVNQVDPETGEKVGFQMDTGDHGVTVSTGPSSDSQREAADDFVSQIIQHPEILGPSALKVVALLVKLKDLGPIGDKISEIIDPTQGNEAIAPQIQQAQQIIKQLQAEVEQLKSGDAIKKYIADTNNQAKIEVALITAKQQAAIVALEQQLGMIQKKMDMQHEAALQASQQAHESQQSQFAQAHEANQSAADAANQRQMQAQDAASSNGNE